MALVNSKGPAYCEILEVDTESQVLASFAHVPGEPRS